MPVADPNAQHLSSLRQFARHLTCRHADSDRRVSDCLRRMAGAGGATASPARSRVDLYRAFLEHSRGAACAVAGAAGGPAEKAACDADPARTAFVLTEVEGFSADEAAEIMAIRRADIDRLLAVAAAGIAAQPPSSVLLIEDDPILALDIEALVETLGHEILGVGRTRREAVMLARKLEPGLILADIQLADDSSGIEAVNEFLSEVDAPVIFVTAYPHMLVRDEIGTDALLVTKPYDPVLLRSMIGRALYLGRGGNALGTDPKGCGLR